MLDLLHPARIVWILSSGQEPSSPEGGEIVGSLQFAIEEHLQLPEADRNDGGNPGRKQWPPQRHAERTRWGAHAAG
jgi:hypothetical protein